MADKRIGFDIGGTFIDYVLVDEETETVEVYKHPTTDDPARGALEGLTTFMNETDTDWSDIYQIIHATTLSTNTVLERDGAETALLTTAGFKDVSILGRQKRYDLYDVFIEKPEPIIPREDIYEVEERLHPREGVVRELDEDHVRDLAAQLEQSYESVAISFLHSYQDDRHESKVEEIIAEVSPGLAVSRSSVLSGLFREYERTNTAAVDAYIKPQMRQYLSTIDSALDDLEYEGTFFLMKSSGGVATPQMVQQAPVQMIESGPVAGALNSSHIGETLEESNVFSFDMGGTTAKICFIVDGEPHRTDVFEIDEKRMKKGSGIPINLPVIDMIEISAGGGSIASVEETGTISVGPESAGSDPGPISYGFGGDRPTITDADLALGYLNPDYFLGGEMTLDKSAALDGIESEIAKPLGIDVSTAAWGIKRVVDNSMTQASRIHASERGLDLRRFTMVSFGGAGPMHAVFLARALNVPKVIVPSGAGVASSLGLMVADIEFHLDRTDVMTLETDALADIKAIYEDLEAQGRASVEQASGIGRRDVTIERTADMKYKGQAHDITISIPPGEFNETRLNEISERFHRTYERTYGYSDPGEPIEGVTWKIIARNPTETPPEYVSPGSTGRGENALKGTREAYFDRTDGFTECKIYDREHLTPGDDVPGPAIIEAVNSTTVVPPGDSLTVDEYGDLVITIEGK